MRQRIGAKLKLHHKRARLRGERCAGRAGSGRVEALDVGTKTAGASARRRAQCGFSMNCLPLLVVILSTGTRSAATGSDE
jgi:hypothetical protein